jgi:hypothetical protein
MDKDTEYEEINIDIDGVEYTVDFVIREYWDWVDHGIGPYDYHGAFGVHEDWQWELKELEIFDIFIHEYNDGQLITKSDLNDWDKDFANKIKKACLKIGWDDAEEPEQSGSYYYNTKDYYDEDDYRNTYLD